VPEKQKERKRRGWSWDIIFLSLTGNWDMQGRQ